MKVMCINDKWSDRPGHDEDLPHPIFGEECIVVGGESAHGSYYYRLAGYPFHLGYIEENFAQIGTEVENIQQEHHEPLHA